MSTLRNSAARLLAWLQRHVLALVAAALTLGLIVVIFLTTFRLYDERQATLKALQRSDVAFCERGNALRSALRDYLRQTILIRPIPPGADDATRVEIEERNRSARAALERGDRSFAHVDCAALAAELRKPAHHKENP